MFVNELGQFLQGEDALGLNIATRESLASFIEAVKKGQWQGTQVDGLRAKHPLLAITAKIGSQLFNPSPGESDFKVESQALSAQWYQNLQEMTLGEKRIFLTGTILHDTRLKIEKLLDGWLFTSYDSAWFPWFPAIRELKINDEKLKDIFIDETLGKLSHPTSRRIPENNTYSIGSLASLPPQRGASCHVRGLIAALKDWLVRGNAMPTGIAVEQWHAFEVLFGAFLLKDKRIEDAQLLNFSKKQLEFFKERYQDIQELKKYDDDEKLHAIIAAYSACLESVNLLISYDVLDDNLSKIIASHNAFIDGYGYFLLNDEMLDLIATDYPEIAPCTFRIAKKYNLIKQGLYLPFLDQEFIDSQSVFNEKICAIKKSLVQFGRENELYSVVSLCLDYKYINPVAIEVKLLDAYLAKLQKINPLIDNEFKPFIQTLLRQAFQNARFIELEHILTMSAATKEEILRSFNQWIHARNFFLIPSWITKASLYLKNNPQSPIKPAILEAFQLKANKNKDQIGHMDTDEKPKPQSASSKDLAKLAYSPR